MRNHLLLVVQNNSFPSDKRVLKEARSLKKGGFDVSVISPSSGLDSGKETEFEGMRVLRYRNFESQGGVAAFFLEYANAVLMIFFLALRVYIRKPFEVIHAANPPDFFWPMALFFKLFGVRFIFDQHDIAPEMLKANQGKEGMLYRMLLLNEYLTIRCASAIVTVNESLKKRLLDRYGIDRKPVAVVYNCPNADFDAEVNPQLAGQYAGKKVVLFVGLMAPLDGVQALVEAAEKIISGNQRLDCVFVLLGDGPERPRLEAMVEDLGLQEQIVFTGLVDYEMVKNYLALADVCVAPDEKNEFSDHFTLVKVLEYMKAGKPFVGFRLHETCLIAGNAGCYADSQEEFVQQIERLLDDPKLAEHYGELGRKIIEEQYLWEHQEQVLLDVYRKVLA